MSTAFNLSNAPIFEALVDIRVVASKDVSNETFLGAHKILEAEYPKKVAKKSFTTNIEVVAGKSSVNSAQEMVDGYFFKTNDEKTVVQFRRDGFTFNKLRPYSSWNDIFPEAMRLWNVYREVVKPDSVTRVALRYINRLEFNILTSSLSELLKEPPKIPKEVRADINSFLQRLALTSQTHKDIKALVTMLFEPEVDSNSEVLVLDIDAFRLVEGDLTEQVLADVLLLLRNYKNELFFNLLTDEILERYK